MAYRFENGEIILDGFQMGVADGPYAISSPSALGPINQTGTTNLSYGNILGVPGEFSVEYPLAAASVTGTLATPVHKAVQISGATAVKYYVLDSSGFVFTSSNGTSWTRQTSTNLSGGADVIGNSGLVYWQGYLIAIRGTSIYYSSDDGANFTDWTSTFLSANGGSIAGGNTHYAIASQFNPSTMYFCNGAFVAQLVQNYGQTFDPTNAATYNAQSQAVALPNYDFATCLAEIANQVLIGGGLARVYVWNAATSGQNSVANINNVLFLGDRFAYRIVVMNTNAYIFTGTPTNNAGRGNIYVSNGSNVDLFKKMPDFLNVTLGGSYSTQEPIWTFGDAMYHRNRLFFGAKSASGTGGVWCIDIASGSLFRTNLMSAGASALPTVISPSDIGTPTGQAYWVGSSAGFDYSSNTLSTSAVMTSDLIPVGTKFKPDTIDQIEVRCATPLATGESIDVVAYTDGSLTPQTVGSMTSSDGMSKIFTPLALTGSISGVQGYQWIQVQCTLNPTNSSPTYVRLREVRLRPNS